MSGIKMSDCQFYVNENTKTVVCVIPHTQSLLFDFIIDNFNFNDYDMWEAMSAKFLEGVRLPKSFMGKAVCAEGDEWNEETGRLIAYSRAKEKCYKSFFKRANKVVQHLDQRLNDMITAFNDFGLKLESNREVIAQKIDEKLGK